MLGDVPTFGSGCGPFRPFFCVFAHQNIAPPSSNPAPPLRRNRSGTEYVRRTLADKKSQNEPVVEDLLRQLVCPHRRSTPNTSPDPGEAFSRRSGDKGLTAEIAEERGAKNGGDQRYHGEVPDAAIRAPPISGPGLLESS